MLNNYSLHMSFSAFGLLSTFIAMPVLSRLFTGESFVAYGIFLSTHFVFGSILSLRHELLIAKSKSNFDAYLFLFKSIVLGTLIGSILLILFFLMFWVFEIKVFGVSFELMVLVMMAAWLQNMIYIFQQYSIYCESHAVLRFVRALQPFSLCCFQIMFGFFGFIEYGLVAGHIASCLIVVSYMFFKLKIFDSFSGQSLSMPNYFTGNSFDLIKFNVPETFISTFSSNLPMLFLASSLHPDRFPSIFFAIRLLSAVSNLVVSASSSNFNINLCRSTTIGKLVVRNISRDTVILLSFFLLIGGLPGEFFVTLFGAAYMDLKQSILILSPWFFFRTVVSSVSYLTVFLDLMRGSFIATLIATLFRVSLLFFPTGLDSLVAISLGGSVYYVIYFFPIFVALRRS